MLDIAITGFKHLQVSHLVLDFNGTIACDGRLIEGVRDLLLELSHSLELHALTADTHGNVARELADVPCDITVISREGEAESKLAYIDSLGRDNVIAIGNGRNDRLMLSNASLGIGVIQDEGCAREAFMAADIVVSSILDALNLLRYPLRLVATLRS